MWKKALFAVLCAVIVTALLPKKDTFDENDIVGKRALVTGASSGLGEELAYELARIGASVFITARRASNLEKVVAKCKEMGHPNAKFGFFAAAMDTDEAARELIEEAVEHLGGLDMLFLNHASIYYKTGLSFWTFGKEDNSKLVKGIEINFLSYVYITNYAMPYLKSSSGAIGISGSIATKLPIVNVIGHSATKSAMVAFFTGLRKELKLSDTNVTVTLCTLGLIDTQMAREFSVEFAKALNTKFTDVVGSWSSPTEAACEIIEATSQGEDELYVPQPWWNWGQVLVNHLWSGMEDYELNKIKQRMQQESNY